MLVAVMEKRVHTKDFEISHFLFIKIFLWEEIANLTHQYYGFSFTPDLYRGTFHIP